MNKTTSNSTNLTWSSPISQIKGIGPKRSQALSDSDINTAGDIINIIPRSYLDKSTITNIRDLEPGKVSTIISTIVKIVKTRGHRSRLIITSRDNTGFISCTWFIGAKYVSSKFKLGDNVAFTGKIGFYNGLQMVHPEFEILLEDSPTITNKIQPIYSEHGKWKDTGADNKKLRNWIKSTLENITYPISQIPSVIIKNNKLKSLQENFEQIHFPNSIKEGNSSIKKYRFRNLFVYAYTFLKLKEKNINKGITFKKSVKFKKLLMESLDFKLTTAQQNALEQIETDIVSKKRMNRLLQGDVGSGKTIVAVLACMHAIENGYQALLMAPTEILVNQHFKTIKKLLEPLGITVGIITGKMKSAQKKEAIDSFSDGSVQFIVGTHALFTKITTFHKPGIIIIDEQHRFGVEQRNMLLKKGNMPDLLTMSATPIPRTMSLIMYGDMDISVIDKKPPGRKPVKTRIVPESKRTGLYNFIKEKVTANSRIYFILPLIEETEKMEDITSAIKTAKNFRENIFPNIGIELLHGKLKPNEKEKALENFYTGICPILVSTTVVEVGMDVKEANIMVIENAERFGLSQLHQLRGRIGRGDKESFCFLLTSPNISQQSKERILNFCSTNDGFKIAEMDLESRGPGSLLGYNQSGFFTKNDVVNPFLYPNIFLKARSEAEKIINKEYTVTAQEIKRLEKTSEKLLKSIKEQKHCPPLV